MAGTCENRTHLGRLSPPHNGFEDHPRPCLYVITHPSGSNLSMDIAIVVILSPSRSVLSYPFAPHQPILHPSRIETLNTVRPLPVVRQRRRRRSGAHGNGLTSAQGQMGEFQ